MKRLFLASVIFALISAISAFAHCEIPCGIYNDQLRSDLIAEHITTIEKSINEIERLSKETPVNYNQLVRWITNKEDHANQLQEIVTQYFMTQRVALVDPNDAGKVKKYQEQLGLLHQLLVYAMKTKQSLDPENITKLREILDLFNKSYFGENYKRHTH
ncbi:MAG: hypothetical protein JXR46_01410 [Calditrichaceae bacterium]|nr:hypothetical protein [Calditrichaceae bacterium]MBN2707675.1 hypothetical protein [Calditrichaceae bacterium]RQV97793.1 MAG: superoxide dismutase [Calditrichota bacterium]